MTSQSPLPAFIIVRHARPDVLPEQSAASWPLTPEGRASATVLGECLRTFGALRITASTERKAIQTGGMIAPGTPITTDERFGEQGLGTVPFLPNDAFRDRVIAHFRQPSARVLGEEASCEAAHRFDAAINDRIGAHSDDMIPVIVSHGRIISAWLTMFARPATNATVPADILWASLGMPDAFQIQREANDRNGWIWRRFDFAGDI